MFSSPALRLYRGKVAVIFVKLTPVKIACSPEAMGKQMANSPCSEDVRLSLTPTSSNGSGKVCLDLPIPVLMDLVRFA